MTVAAERQIQYSESSGMSQSTSESDGHPDVSTESRPVCRPVADAPEPVLRTLLVSDLVGSTKLVEELGDQVAHALFERHDRLARDLLEKHRGREIDKTDGFLLLFDRSWNAVRYALAYHAGLRRLSAEQGRRIAARVGDPPR